MLKGLVLEATFQNGNRFQDAFVVPKCATLESFRLVARELFIGKRVRQ